MAERLFGLETEYAFAALDQRGAALDRHRVLTQLLQIARQRLPHLLDGTRRGMFVANGGRFYIDAPDFPEFSTPEVDNPWDAVRYLQAGDRIVADLAAALVGLPPCGVAQAIVLRCNVDYSGTDSTWGAHESYMHCTPPHLLPGQLIPFLVSRVVISGAGGFNSLFPHGLQFTLSPRAWHLVQSVSGASTHARGVFHTKDEPMASAGYHRLHILAGESLCSEIAAWLKVATTALVVALVDGGVCPGDCVQLKLPVAAMRRFASDPACRVRAETIDGRRLSALDIQRHYLQQAEQYAGASFMPWWAGEACRQWRAMLERLEHGAHAVATMLDWAIKLPLYQARARRRGIAWEAVPSWSHIAEVIERALVRVAGTDPRPGVDVVLGPKSPIAATVKRLTTYVRERGLAWDAFEAFLALRRELFEVDARFAELGDRGIFAALDRAGVLAHRVPGVDNIDHAIEQPPAIGRARARGAYVRQLSNTTGRYLCDWNGVWDYNGKRCIDLNDPFAAGVEWQPWDPSTGQLNALRSALDSGIGL